VYITGQLSNTQNQCERKPRLAVAKGKHCNEVYNCYQDSAYTKQQGS